MTRLEFDELRQLFRLDTPSAPPAATAPPTALPASSPTSAPAPANTSPTPSTSFSSASLSTADLDLDAELAALTLSHNELQALLADSGPVMRPSRESNTSEFSSHYNPTVPTAPLNFKKMGWNKPIAQPRGNELEGVDDLTEEEARALARELGLDEEDVEMALKENAVGSTVSQPEPTTSGSAAVPLGPTPDEVPILASVLDGPGSVGPAVDQAEFASPPKDDDPIAAATHGELAPPVPAPVPLGPNPAEVPALASILNSPPGVLDMDELSTPPKDPAGPGPLTGQIGSPPTSPPKAPAPPPLGPDPTLSPRATVAFNEHEIHGPVIDEGEFSEPPKSADGGPGPTTGQLSPPTSPRQAQGSPTSRISPVPVRPVSEMHLEKPAELVHLPSLEEVRTPAVEKEDEVEVLGKTQA